MKELELRSPTDFANQFLDAYLKQGFHSSDAMGTEEGEARAAAGIPHAYSA